MGTGSIRGKNIVESWKLDWISQEDFCRILGTISVREIIVEFWELDQSGRLLVESWELDQSGRLLVESWELDQSGRLL
jgi:hypothetical protein